MQARRAREWKRRSRRGTADRPVRRDACACGRAVTSNSRSGVSEKALSGLWALWSLIDLSKPETLQTGRNGIFQTFPYAPKHDLATRFRGSFSAPSVTSRRFYGCPRAWRELLCGHRAVSDPGAKRVHSQHGRDSQFLAVRSLREGMHGQLARMRHAARPACRVPPGWTRSSRPLKSVDTGSMRGEA